MTEVALVPLANRCLLDQELEADLLRERAASLSPSASFSPPAIAARATGELLARRCFLDAMRKRRLVLTTTSGRIELLELPRELLTHLLASLPAVDIVIASRSCQALRILINSQEATLVAARVALLKMSPLTPLLRGESMLSSLHAAELGSRVGGHDPIRSVKNLIRAARKDRWWANPQGAQISFLAQPFDGMKGVFFYGQFVEPGEPQCMPDRLTIYTPSARMGVAPLSADFANQAEFMKAYTAYTSEMYKGCVPPSREPFLTASSRRQTLLRAGSSCSSSPRPLPPRFSGTAEAMPSFSR